MPESLSNVPPVPAAKGALCYNYVPLVTSYIGDIRGACVINNDNKYKVDIVDCLFVNIWKKYSQNDTNCET